MTAVLLAAGISSRLRPLTDAMPKSMLPIGSKPLLHRTLEILQRAGIVRCIVVTGYLHERMESFIHTLGLRLRVDFVHNQYFSSTNNNYSLWLARKALKDEAMLLLDADILFDPRILARLLEDPHDNALVMRQSKSLSREEIKLELDGSGRVMHIGKEIDLTATAGESLGIEKFDASTAQKLFDVLDQRKDRNEFYEASFQEIIDRGASIYAVDSGPYPCIEIDTLEDLAMAEKLTATLPQ
jgi:choline kinase